MQNCVYSYMRFTWLIILFLNIHLYSQSLQIIPKPSEGKLTGGEPFLITKNTPFFFVSGRCMANVIEFNSLLKKTYGFEMPWIMEVTDSNQKFIFLHLTKDSTITNAEGYQIESNKDWIKITATTRTGIFYGMVSILQLMQPSMDGEGAFTVPACKINDQPRFSWRGMHLDVCRHFFGKEFIKKYIDMLALHKMNTFHWHLTEDQGWRIEIKKYPKLTEIGAWRNGSMIGRYSDHQFDTIRYGGYYSQDDIREIVKYAASRHITIIPEIEMPGHSLAALASYPELSCTGGPFEVSKEWGVFEDVYCAGNENTFKFMEDVLTEVCALFPGKYIHIGGDECPKERWKTCPKCQKRIKDEGLKDEHELQSYFIRRIEKFLNSKGKQIIGWDEILEGGLAPNAAVMSWRGEQGGIEAANQQHDVVMSPGTHCYFDHYQGDPELEPIAIGGFTTVEKVYSYEPIPAGLNDSLEKYIMGAQGNVWTEYILNEKHVEYMAFPRMSALAEVLWTQKEKKDQNDFQDRLIRHFDFLDKWDVNYSASLYQVQLKPQIKNGKFGVQVIWKPNISTVSYHKTLLGESDSDKTGGGMTCADGCMYQDTGFVEVNESCRLKFFTNGGLKSQIIDLYLSKSTGKHISFSTQPNSYYSYQSDFTLLDGVKADMPRKSNQWNAWYGADVEMIVDLENTEEISQVEIGYLNDPSNWIWLPKEIMIEGSVKGKKYKLIETIGTETIQQNPRQVLKIFKKQKFRYIKIIAKNAGKIPAGNPGAGEDSWLFFDEILIN